MKINRTVVQLALISAVVVTFSGCSHMSNSPSMKPAGQVVEATLQVGTTNVPYRDSGGSGIPVVFLHAASGKSAMWLHQIPAFTAAGFRVIAIDWRQPNPGSPPGSHSAVLIDAVLGKLGVQQAHFVGTAAGGGAAFTYALTHPEKVRSLVIANASGSLTDREYIQMTHRIRPAPQFEAMPVDFRELGPSYRAANPEGVARWNAMAHNFAAAAPTLAPAAPATGGAPRPAVVPGSNVKITWARLETLRMPTILMTGDADLYTPPSVLRMFAERIKHAETAIIPESGHSAFWEQPEIFNRTALAFLRKH
jgi:pimeloyl-ACP methyl ester carboxylesterase